MTYPTTPKTILIAALVLLLPLIGGSLVRDGLRDFQGKNRTVSVRGLAEKEVTADLAAWPFIISSTNNDLSAAQNELERQEKALRTYLSAAALDESDISVLRYEAQDLLAQQYRPEGVERGRYVLTKTLLLRSKNVDAVQKASQGMDALVKQGVALGGGSQPAYLFTLLNDVKPAMIKEATHNAYEAAMQFAHDSGARVGGIVNASQGVFSIAGRDEIDAVSADAQLHKKLRVVTSVTYRLE